MARISRVVVPGHPHHVTQRGVRSLDIFHSDEDRNAYLRLLRTHTQRQGVQILAWCLMTNHVHFIAIPSEEPSLAKAFGEAHRLYTRMKNFSLGVRGYFFQGRFSSCVLDERHLVAAARYVEQNPVRAKVVSKPWEYQRSSAQYHVGRISSDLLVSDRTLLGLVQNWHDLLSGTDDEGNETIRKRAKTGRPAGDEAFVERIEGITGRALIKRKAGRPRKIGTVSPE